MIGTAGEPTPEAAEVTQMLDPDTDPSVKRKRIRFRPDALDYAQIECNGDCSKPFAPESVGIIVDEEPMGGCCVIVLDNGKLHLDDFCRVKVGRLDPLRAQIVWRKELEAGILRVGLEFLE
jgi:hypothetical protein